MSKSDFRVDVLTNEFKALQSQAPDLADQAIRAIALDGVAYIKMLITNSPATGRAYQRGSRTHIASSPGQAPRVDTGALRASIRMRPAGYLVYEVVDGVEYGVQLEFGTRRFAPRPFMSPGVRHMRTQIEPVVKHFMGQL